MGESRQEVHSLACFVHGALTALHLLGMIYNGKRKNWWDVGMHGLGAAYSVKATLHHAERTKRVLPSTFRSSSEP